MQIPTAIGYATTTGQMITEMWPLITVQLGILIGFALLKFVTFQISKAK